MLFKYEAIAPDGKKQTGNIDALNQEIAIGALQRRGLKVLGLKNAEGGGSILKGDLKINIFQHVSNKDVVILSRQLATLFNAQISALRIFSMLAGEAENVALRKHLMDVADDIQAGSAMSIAMAKHPKVFSDFYVNMVRAGEESGKLDQTFNYLADYLDRTYEVTAKAKGALVYPAFIIIVFVGVMTFMMVSIIPKITGILKESGQELPIYTKIVMWISDALLNYGIYILIALIIGGFLLFRFKQTPAGKVVFSTIKLKTPYFGNLFRKLYFSRISENVNTMLSSAIPIVKTLEITSSVVGDVTFENILKNVTDDVRTGSSVADAFSKHPEMPGMMVQMIRVGEESGELGKILETLAKFYNREVMNAVDSLVSLIEPAMIILLAVGVGFLLVSVLMPIYNMTSSIT